MPTSQSHRITVTTTVEVDLSQEPGSAVRRPPRYALVILCGNETELAPLDRGAAVVIGREFPCEVRLDDSSISRQHARFLVRDGAVLVEDLGSRNGTYVNGQRVTEATVNTGDEVRLGNVVVSLAATRSEPEAPQMPTAGDRVLRNRQMLDLYALARRAARTEAPVLITGETGSGKEHLAQTVHGESPRSEKPFVALNCGAIPANLIESTLFGHERGAFTGADRRARGIFEEAEGGVVFLDELGELPLSAQAALLRVLETKRVRRVGAHEETAVDVRVVAATHCNLSQAIEEGEFREDLFYRLNAITLEVPPLRDRVDEIEPLAELFLAQVRREWGTPAREFHAECMKALRRYPWPGNVRQLRNVVERAALVAAEPLVRIQDLPRTVLHEPSPSQRPTEPISEIDEGDPALKSRVKDYEAKMIRRALERTGGNREAAARLLRVPIRTLFRRMKALKIDGA